MSYISYEMMQKDHHAVDVLLAEIDIYELFAFKHCNGRKVKLSLCEGNNGLSLDDLLSPLPLLVRSN